MLINTSITIAYKCPSCGSFEFSAASLFTLAPGKALNFDCRCGASGLVVSCTKQNYSIKIPCIGCGSCHEYEISRKQLINREINIFYCPVTGLSQCFTGRDEPVRKWVDHIEKEFDELIDTFGYESYFENSRVMLDSLNKIHDLAEEGNLCCECGCKDIELTLLADKIHLRCKRCSTRKVINAATNNDLKDILMKQQIILLDGIEKGDIGNITSLKRKSDGK